MANINDIIKELDKNKFYVIKQEITFEDGKYNESDKVCIGQYPASTIKSEYVKLYKSARIDGIKPTIKPFEGLYDKIPQWGLSISSTEVNYWIIRGNADWKQIYNSNKPKVKLIDQASLDHPVIVPSKGYTLEWNPDHKMWDVWGFGRGGSPIYVGSTKYAKAIDLTWKVWASGGWHCNILRIDLDEQPLPEDAVEITDGKHNSQNVVSTEYGIFTSMGETYAQGSFSTTHKS